MKRERGGVQNKRFANVENQYSEEKKKKGKKRPTPEEGGTKKSPAYRFIILNHERGK